MKKTCCVGVFLLCCVLGAGLAGCTGSTTATSNAAGDPVASESTIAPAVVHDGAWTELPPTGSVPPARVGQSMAYDSVNARMILFGGLGLRGTLGDTWSYDPAADKWSELGPSGVPTEAFSQGRYGQAMAYDPSSRKMILVGGVTYEATFADTWAYDPAANTWTELHPSGDLPFAREGHSMVYDPSHHRVILFGGEDVSFSFNDTWAYDPAANAWTNLIDLQTAGDSPPGRSGHCMVYVPTTGKVIIFGGAKEDSSVIYADIWAYDPTNNTWTELHPTGNLPGARSCHSMVWDAGSGQIILFGGMNSEGLLNDTWAYDPVTNTWTELHPTGHLPSARATHSAVFDPASDQIILFGGFDRDYPTAAPLNETWAYGRRP